ncbi:hypothetical protein [Amycolatopsis sp. DG1A-15b]|uniref:hypothetical protein n=1 Tax=Amycolatopsis sp. DG1A-15b TaxID=3052846 RepID=UPI00255B801D|nr:hypothetical protein [Amycolatopsis sp. DG1A-15b]WIX90680.1 hypothetical protein QRY02_09710 [Amycolatopsis sp. DG1A-15b]
MIETAWVRSPVGRADRHYATRRGTKSVLVLVPHPVAGTRLFDLLPLLEADHRIQVVFADPEAGDNWQAGPAFLRAHGRVVLPWPQARRSEFDLVLAGSTRGLDDLAAPTLLVPHGGGFGQYRPWRPPDTAVPRARRHGTGLSPDQLMREGRLRADALALVHDRERTLLARECPQALPAAVVTGDIALDRLTASLPHRDHYRRALGAAAGQEVVVVTSTWSPRSAFGRHPGLFDGVLAELPGDRFRVVGALHRTSGPITAPGRSGPGSPTPCVPGSCSCHPKTAGARRSRPPTTRSATTGRSPATRRPPVPPSCSRTPRASHSWTARRPRSSPAALRTGGTTGHCRRSWRPRGKLVTATEFPS